MKRGCVSAINTRYTMGERISCTMSRMYTSRPTNKREQVRNRGIPPTEVGGSFRPSLQMNAVDYFLNPTHGSGWIVQVQSTQMRIVGNSWNTTHGSGWIVQAQPTKRVDRP